MKIAILWEQESWGGVDTHLLELLETWPNKDDEFVLLYNHGNEGYDRIKSDLEQLNNLTCFPISVASPSDLSRKVKLLPLSFFLRTVIYFTKPILFPFAIFQLKKVLQKYGPFDVLLANNGGYPGAWAALAAIPAAKQAEIPLRTLLVHHSANKPGIFMGWFEYYVDKIINATVDIVICVSYATRKTLLENRNFNENTIRMRVVHNTLTPPDFSRLSETENSPLQNLKQEGEFLIGLLGRVEAYKGHEDMIFALSRLDNDEQEKFRLVIIGRGEDDEIDRLKKITKKLKLEKRVHFLGYVDTSSMVLISQLDILAMLTWSFEGFGLTVAEAKHVETSVIVSRVGAIPEFVDESTGYIVNSCAPSEVTAALRDFLNKPEEWHDRKQRAKEKITQISSGMYKEYSQIFNECLLNDSE